MARGTIEKRGENSWRLNVSMGIGANGKYKRKRKTVKAKNKTEATRLLNDFIYELDNGKYVAPSKIMFVDYVEVWKRYAQKKLSPKTIETYDYVLKGRIIPSLAHRKMEDITSYHLTDFLHSLESDGLSTSTIQKHYNVLSNIFKFATKHRTIKNNPMERVDKPSVTYKKGEVYTPSEVEHLFQLLDGEENKQMALIVKLALKTGMRKGEILALQWDDVDFSTNRIQINHSLSYTKEQGYQLTAPKTEGSIRKVAIPEILHNELKKHIFKKKTERMEASELWEGGEYYFVFSSVFGKPFYPNVPNRWWTRFFNRINKQLEADNEPPLKKIRFHDLRHTFATDLISKGGNINKISKYLGHASITTTVDTYGHLLEDDKELEDLINENVN